MHIGLTYDLQVSPTDPRQAEFDPPRVIDAVCAALEALGHELIRLGSPQALLAAPDRLRSAEIVFNLAEGTHGRCREAWVPTLLELFDVPYVGSDPLALCLGLDKLACKRLARSAGLATPAWVAIETPAQLPQHLELTFPAIVKPRYEGSGRGIDEGAIVMDRQALARRVAWLFDRLRQPLLLEEFIAGGELTVCLIGNSLPTAYPAIQRPLDVASGLSCHVAKKSGAPSAWHAPLELTEALDRDARRMATAMFEALGCRDVARVDLRVDAQGRLFFLEINPLPSFDPEGSFGLLAEHLGVPYAQFIGRVLEAAGSRLGMHQEPVASR